MAALTPQERAVYEEYIRNEKRTADGSLQAAAKLHIDRDKLDFTTKAPRDLVQVRRSDSGKICGPKAAFLGELKHLFPDHVARGVVVPSGRTTTTTSTRRLPCPRTCGVPASPPPASHCRTSSSGPTRPSSASSCRGQERARAVGLDRPRLDVIQHSIEKAPLSTELRDGIRTELDRVGLLTGPDKRDTVGCFVRSDTNVEDLDNFNGAGLNLTSST